MTFSPISDVLDALRAGKPVIVSDAADRENEGDAIMSAALATPEWIAWMVRNTSGYLCAPLPGELADRLALPPMVVNNEDTRRTAYTITVDASSGVTTGISAHDRARTLNLLADPDSTPASFIRPGHILPVRAVDGGVRERAGHTEAAVELMRAAGLSPVGVIGEMIAEDGSAMRMDDLLATGEREGLPVTTIELLIEWLNEQDGREPDAPTSASARVTTPATSPDDVPAASPRVHFEVETSVPTTHGLLRMRAYRDLETGADHVAIVSGDPTAPGSLVRVHSECLTGEAFGSLKCECGPQLDASLDLIAEHGGVVVYLRGHEGRGIGLVNKLRAYRLQEDGLDTLDANVALGLPADARDYGAAVAILDDLGTTSIHLLTNNPEKVRQLEAHGIDVAERIPLVVGASTFNQKYLDTKRDRMGHVLPSAVR
ncbi:GTP cyclohydrolase II [Herbiconiux ginsengi]|uniref:GTP cyclohydrolase-2 n=1 Tax=Herbiconiux ginsengi TaxID=381665 RepID=A0A1H3SRI8_9MICO|nr:GTP cyclohydrolase II [Herbiconiux ginsengi]SDZ40330.1 3,4-dihydroxy 2-butanone 4-phosphate synthase / GTP cyclohydrolase II [Herbiconiux ginsengi]